MIVSKRAIRAFLDRPLTSWSWMKRMSRDDLTRALSELRQPPRFKTEPWLHQLVGTYLGITQPRFLFLYDMGLGKSKLILDLLTYAIRSGEVKRGIIVVPRSINVASWVDAVREHSDLEPWPVDCQDIGEKRARLLAPRGQVTLVDLAGLTLAGCDKVRNKLEPNVDVMSQVAALHKFVDIDESHKVATDESLRFTLLDTLTSNAARAYATTGTLIGNRVERAWPQFFLVDRGVTLGESPGLFQASFFIGKPHPFKGQTLEFDKRKARALHLMLQHRSLRYEDDEVHELPLLLRRRRIVEMTEEQAGHYARALDGIVQLPAGDQRRSSPWVRMRQVAAGYLAWTDEYGKHAQRFDGNPKLDLLESMVVDELTDSKAVIVYHYTETGKMIVDRLRASCGDERAVEWLHGGSRDKAGVRRAFLDDPNVRVLVLNDDFDSGVDELQHVARYMLMYESPTAPDKRKQIEKRIHRPGQRHRCHVYDLVTRGTLDAGILTSLDEGFDLHDAVLAGRLSRDRTKKLLSGG